MFTAKPEFIAPGVAGAVYRFENYGWNYDTAYKEMKNYNFYSGLFHGKLKSYVKDYYAEREEEKADLKLVPAATIANH